MQNQHNEDVLTSLELYCKGRKNQSYLFQQLYQKLGEMNIATKNTRGFLGWTPLESQNLEPALILVTAPQLHSLLEVHCEFLAIQMWVQCF